MVLAISSGFTPLVAIAVSKVLAISSLDAPVAFKDSCKALTIEVGNKSLVQCIKRLSGVALVKHFALLFL